jgi:NADH:ubiquinone oxidoreductase subunit F (NADH-binding)
LTRRILAGPALAAGAESLADHEARLGALPGAGGRAGLPATLERAGLLGRGGAGFPVGRKWASVAARADGKAALLANGAEGEPLSVKDRVLMASRPHLVLDGIELAAGAVGADRIAIYVGEEHDDAGKAIARALKERRARDGRRAMAGRPVRLIAAPTGYVSGEESAAVHYVNESVALPVTVPPRPYERGIDGRPTLVQNVESLAVAALIGRYGEDWYREPGTGPTRGTALVTVSGAPRNGLTEIEFGTTVGEVAARSGIETPRPVMIGGYFGGWIAPDAAWSMPLDPAVLKERGSAFGAGILAFLEPDRCGVTATARILDTMAGESAGQCGPCVFGLRAIADAAARIARGRSRPDDLSRLFGWTDTLAGRGACRMPDGALGLLRSSLRVFRDEFEGHQHHRRCTASREGWAA